MAKKLKKIEKLASESLLNGLRLHRDSITLYKNGAIPSSYMLSILSQEEIGKSFLTNDVVFQDVDNVGIDSKYAGKIVNAMLSHRIKQASFSREVDDFLKYHGKKYPRIISEISSGKLNERKQNATYVGVTKKGNKPDLIGGKLIIPIRKVKPEQAKFHITRVNDFLISLIEGSRRGLLYIEDPIDKLLTIDLVKELEVLWPNKSKEAIFKLRKYRRYDIEDES